jgi:hypothetical protein
LPASNPAEPFSFSLILGDILVTKSFQRMSWFQLDSNSVAARVRASGRPAELSCLGTSVQRGIVGFTLLSIAGFAPWAIAGRWLYRNIGEGGLYAVCALVFVLLSGPLLHRLIIGPGSFARFYKLFGLTFAVYSILWVAGWMMVRGHPGSVVGLLAGTTAMGWTLACAFDAKARTPKVIAALFVLNSIGYFAGGWIEGAIMGIRQISLFGAGLGRPAQAMLAKLLWGVCYGVGFGAGLGFAFHFCQEKTREVLRALELR